MVTFIKTTVFLFVCFIHIQICSYHVTKNNVKQSPSAKIHLGMLYNYIHEPCYLYLTLDYCNSLLSGKNRGLLKRLQNVQRNAARLITKNRNYDPISGDVIELHWLPIEQRIDFKIMVLRLSTFKSSDYISSILQLWTDSRHLCSTSFAPQLVQPRTQHMTFADRAFSCQVPRKWH